ncbi:MAG: 4-hydroxy-tetrahydrodipicolinate synthase [Methanonatronarchaeales archaeon]|nr:4-hydroxy-tetrahydrodipicolinate synthase [Methanonatronarchaeales archaeon]
MHLEGVFTAHATPFDGDEIDHAALERLLDFLIDGGVDGVVTAGCTGEAATLSHDEHREIVEVAVNLVDGRTRVVAGTGSNSTREAVELTGHAETAGADAAMLITPYYNRPPQRGLVKHFTAVAEAVSIPIVLYNVPSRTGVNMEPETVLRLAELDNVVAVKEASGDVSQAARILEEASDDFSVLSGDDSEALATAALGGSGVVSVAGNLVPGKMRELFSAASRGDLKEAREVHRRLSPLFRALFLETNPIPVKRALNLVGLGAGEPRPPLTPLSRDAEGPLRESLRELDLI